MAPTPRPGRWLLAAAVLTAACSCAAQPQLPPELVAAGAPAPAARSSPAVPSGGPQGAGDRLPDLAMLPLEAFHIAYEGKRKVLRFGADVANLGSGPLDITGIRPTVRQRDLHVSQSILRADGSRRTVRTKALMRYEIRDGHDHFHVQDFERYRLRTEQGSTWRVSHKEGFCLRDDGNLGGTASRFDDEHFYCGEDEENKDLRVRQGLSEGWVDVYDWYLEGQFIDLTGLQLPGNYCVEAEADPGHLLTEASRRNNATSTLVRLTATDVSVLRQGC